MSDGIGSFLERPLAFIDQKLDESTCNLLKSPDTRPNILSSLRYELSSFSAEEVEFLVKTLLTGLAEKGSLWNNDKRDGILDVLRLIDYTKFPQPTLVSHYINAVSLITQEADHYNIIFYLLQAGKILSPHLKESVVTREAILHTWHEVTKRLNLNDTALINHEKNIIVNSLAKPFDPH